MVGDSGTEHLALENCRLTMLFICDPSFVSSSLCPSLSKNVAGLDNFYIASTQEQDFHAVTV